MLSGMSRYEPDLEKIESPNYETLATILVYLIFPIMYYEAKHRFRFQQPDRGAWKLTF